MTIYLIRNIVNGKGYVGQTKCEVTRRFGQHCTQKNAYPIDRAIRRHGKNRFVVSVLAECSSREEMNLREAEFIQELGTRVPSGYNLLGGGNAKSHHPETRKRIGNSLRGHSVSEETRAKISAAHRGHTYNLGSKRTEDTKVRMSAAQSGLKKGPMSDEHKAAISAGHKRTPKQYHKQTPESRLKMSLSKKGRPAHNKGIPQTEEAKAKFRATMAAKKCAQ